jgi:hypothetical protein
MSRLDKAIAAFGSHIHVRDQRAAKNRTKMLEHAVAGQRLERRTREVRGVSHQQQVRQAVAVELADRVFGHGQRLLVCSECAPHMHRTDLDPNAGGIDPGQYRLNHLEQNSGP